MTAFSTSDRRPSVAIIGAGPAGLMAADVVSAAGIADVTIFDRMPSPARKLMLAGRGGLNLTHTEDMAAFLGRYGEAEPHLRDAIAAFGPDTLRRWCADLGIETFVGSSGRVFPSAFKTSPMLRAWLRRLTSRGVRLAARHRWMGWDDSGALRFATPDGTVTTGADAAVLALGGASWPHLGSDGGWIEILAGVGVATSDLLPSNCGFVVEWSDVFRDRHEGEPVKNVALTFAGRKSRGDLIVSRTGFEGGAIYQLAAPLRAAIRGQGHATLQIALRPDLPRDAVAARLARGQPSQSFGTMLRKTLNLSPVAIGLLREASRGTPPLRDPEALARLVNALPIRLTATSPIGRAISTAGGIAWAELDSHFMVTRRPGTFAAGEMLDWEAPTGGYLLQACFATGASAGRGVLVWLSKNTTEATR